MRLPDGRRLAWAEYGDPFGYPVILCHGVPGSRRQVPPFDGLTSEMLGTLERADNKLIKFSGTVLPYAIQLEISRTAGTGTRRQRAVLGAR